MELKYYFTIQDETIVGLGQCPCSGENIICVEVTKEQYDLAIEKGNNYYIYQNAKIVVNPNYSLEEANKREEKFKSEFMQTSQGWYRLQPKGYANAQQSMDTINNIVIAMGGLTSQIANMIIFYEEPDFLDETQCTEEWLVAHQYNPSAMTKEDWTTFYVEFTTLYAQEQYKIANEE